MKHQPSEASLLLTRTRKRVWSVPAWVSKRRTFKGIREMSNSPYVQPVGQLLVYFGSGFKAKSLNLMLLLWNRTRQVFFKILFFKILYLFRSCCPHTTVSLSGLLLWKPSLQSEAAPPVGFHWSWTRLICYMIAALEFPLHLFCRVTWMASLKCAVWNNCNASIEWNVYIRFRRSRVESCY